MGRKKKKKKFDYFDAFVRQAEIMCEEADLLAATITNFSTAAELEDVLTKAHEIENRGDLVNHEIQRSVALDFITPIDREDIIALAESLDTATDCIEDVMLRFYMYDIHFMHEDAAKMADVIVDSASMLLESLKKFKHFKKSAECREGIKKVNDYEDQGDLLYVHATRKLYVENYDNPLRVEVWSRIFDRLENCCDQCEEVTEVMGTVIAKNL